MFGTCKRILILKLGSIKTRAAKKKKLNSTLANDFKASRYSHVGIIHII